MPKNPHRQPSYVYPIRAVRADLCLPMGQQACFRGRGFDSGRL